MGRTQGRWPWGEYNLDLAGGQVAAVTSAGGQGASTLMYILCGTAPFTGTMRIQANGAPASACAVTVSEDSESNWSVQRLLAAPPAAVLVLPNPPRESCALPVGRVLRTLAAAGYLVVLTPGRVVPVPAWCDVIVRIEAGRVARVEHVSGDLERTA